MKPRHKSTKTPQPQPKEKKSDPTRDDKVKTYGNPEQAEGVGERRIGGTTDSSYTEKQNQ